MLSNFDLTGPSWDEYGRSVLSGQICPRTECIMESKNWVREESPKNFMKQNAQNHY